VPCQGPRIAKWKRQHNFHQLFRILHVNIASRKFWGGQFLRDCPATLTVTLNAEGHMKRVRQGPQEDLAMVTEATLPTRTLRSVAGPA
jgi:hypothetical protein